MAGAGRVLLPGASCEPSQGLSPRQEGRIAEGARVKGHLYHQHPAATPTGTNIVTITIYQIHWCLSIRHRGHRDEVKAGPYHSRGSYSKTDVYRGTAVYQSAKTM